MKAIFAIYDDRTSLENAVETLKANGFDHSEISVLLLSDNETRDFAKDHQTQSISDAAKPNGSSLLTGITLGQGWLIGASALPMAGMGSLVAAGPLMAAMAAGGIGGTVGGLSSSLKHFGLPESQSLYYENLVKKGGILLSLHLLEDPRKNQEARDILEATGARDISDSSGSNEEDLHLYQDTSSKFNNMNGSFPEV